MTLHIPTDEQWQDLANRVITESEVRRAVDEGLREDVERIDTAIDKTVVADVELDANPSTSLVQLNAGKVNIKSSATTTKNIPLPVASTTQAGVMNSATFNAVAANTNNIAAMSSGAVAATGISASPTQGELTAAWEAETGLTSLINRASIYDVDNDKIWTYYTNTSTWYASQNTPTVVVNTFTNNSEGTIKGSTNVGQVFAENDGTGSVNGWDALSSTVSNHTSEIANKANVSDLAPVATTGSYLDLTDRPTALSSFTNDLSGLAPTVNVGDRTSPVFFSNGSPTACDMTRSGNRYGVLSPVGDNGYMEIGQGVDFHLSDDDTSDFAARLRAHSGGLLTNGEMYSGNSTENGYILTRRRDSWFRVAAAKLDAVTTGTDFLAVTIPAAHRGERWEYKVYISIEADSYSGSSPIYPCLQVQTSSGWRTNYSNFSFLRVGADGANTYTATNSNVAGFEVRVSSAADSATGEVLLSRGGTGWWNFVGRSGGWAGTPHNQSAYMFGGRFNFGDDITGFRIHSSATLGLRRGCSLEVFAHEKAA